MKSIKLLSILGAAAMIALPGNAEETWKSIGIGQYRDNFVNLWAIGINGFPQMDVEIQESTETPGRYRIMDPYKDYPYELVAGEKIPDGGYIIVDASDPVHCFVEMSPTHYPLGYRYEDLMQMAVWSIADDYGNNEYGNWVQADKEGVCGTLKYGSVTFPKGALLCTTVFAEKEIDWNMQWLHGNLEGMFRMRLPGAPKLDVNLIYQGMMSQNKLNYFVDMEDDVEYALVALVEGEYSDATAAGIADGSISSTKLTAPSSIDFDYEKDGIHTLYAVSYYEGKVVDVAYHQEEFSYSEAEWRKCGTARYTEAILSSNEMVDGGWTTIDPDEYDVEIEENVATPGLFRLVNPYGPPYIYADDSNYDKSRNYYMEIDATDPEAVILRRMEPIGLNFAWGRMAIWSRVEKFMQEGMDKETIRGWEALNYPIFGRHADNKITFPENSLYWINLDQPTQPTYWANTNGKFCIQLQPGQVIGGAGVDGITADRTEAQEVWYSLDGTRLQTRPTTAGIYVCRKGNESRKVALK